MCYILIPFLIMLTLFAIIGFERSMWLSVDFWNKKEYKLFKIICGVIGGSFLLVIIFICITNKESSEELNKTILILDLSAFLTMGIFSQIIHLIAWRKKIKMLSRNIKELLEENKNIREMSELLNICYLENREYFTRKQIVRVLKKMEKK